MYDEMTKFRHDFRKQSVSKTEVVKKFFKKNIILNYHSNWKKIRNVWMILEVDFESQILEPFDELSRKYNNFLRC